MLGKDDCDEDGNHDRDDDDINKEDNNDEAERTLLY